MSSPFSHRVALHPVQSYLFGVELIRTLEKMFPKRQCWGFSYVTGMQLVAVLFENEGQASTFAEAVNKEFSIVMNEPLEVSLVVAGVA